MGAALLLVAVVIGADVVEGPVTAYVGVLTCAPFLAAVFSRPLDVVLVGAVSLAAGQAYAATAGAATATPQLVRLAFIATATVVAAGAAAVRLQREHHLREVTTVAEVAQNTILRAVPAVVAGYEVAARYRSAASAARVGGDFYDVVQTPHGLRLVIGDVRGKGLAAVQLAAAVLGSFRELAFSAGPDLDDVARGVGRSVARQVGAEDFVTAVFVQLGPDGRGWLARFGHPLPLAVSEGQVRPIGGDTDVAPLGLAAEPVVCAFQLAQAERLLLHTDGLTEARSPDGRFFDLDRVAPLLARGTLDGAVDRLLALVRSHTGENLADDLAVLLLGHSTVAGARG